MFFDLKSQEVMNRREGLGTVGRDTNSRAPFGLFELVLNIAGAFRFAEPGSLARILAEAGAVDINERVLQFNIAAPISVEQFWKMRSEMSGTLREKLATLSPSEVDLLAKEAKEAVSEFFSNNQMSSPAQMLIVTGRKL